MRRRADAARRQRAHRHGPRRRAHPLPSLPGTAGHRDGAGARAGVARASRLPAARLRRAPARARPARRRQRRAGRRPGAPGARGSAPDRRPGIRQGRHDRRSRRSGGGGAVRVHDRRRRGGEPVRARARDVPQAGVALRHGDPHVLGVAAARRAVDRVGARRQGPQRQPAARLRLDLPRRGRHGEHRRRAAVDVPRLQEREHHPPARRLRPPDRRALADRRRPAGVPADQRPGADGRVRRTRARGRRTSSSATPPAASTRSTARASTTPTRPRAWPPT